MKTGLVAAASILIAASLHAQTTTTVPETPAFPTVRAGGFADVEFHTSSENIREGLDLAELDLYSVAQFSEPWSALAEGVVQKEWRQDDEEARLPEFDLERFYVEYAPNDAFRVEIGQTHTGIVRWNEREHRSRFLQTPIDVPAIARRPQDDGAWPLRFIGIWASGRSSGPLGIAYGAGVGGGSGRERDEVPVRGIDRSAAVILSLSTSPDALPGLELGVSAYAQRIRTEPETLRERDFTLSANYVSNGTELRGEWARMNHIGTRSGIRYKTTGYYALLSKRLAGRFQRARPYLLLDHLDLPAAEVYLQNVTPENAWATGVRYDVTQHFSLKGEFRSQRAPGGERELLLGLQIGLSF
ncbi:MAG: hypothetical protein ACXVH7_02850 [Thermoanaerobaculia bacterium]